MLYNNSNKLGCFSNKNSKIGQLFSGLSTTPILYNNCKKLGCSGNRNKLETNWKTVQLFQVSVQYQSYKGRISINLAVLEKQKQIRNKIS